MVDIIKDLGLRLQPKRISVDYELAAINSFKEAFSGAKILGCFFHLTKNIKKRLGDYHLLGRYNNDAEFAVNVRMVSALAFVRIADLDEAVDELSAALPNELQELLQWFEDNYIGRPNRRGNGRRPPLFHPEIWSVYDRVISETDRTNNHAEAAHRRLQCELSMDHPTIWKFINTLKKIQCGRDVFYEKLRAGFEPPHKLKKYVQADIRIKNIVTEYTTTRTFVEYLKAIAHNYEMAA